MLGMRELLYGSLIWLGKNNARLEGSWHETITTIIDCFKSLFKCLNIHTLPPLSVLLTHARVDFKPTVCMVMVYFMVGHFMYLLPVLHTCH